MVWQVEIAETAQKDIKKLDKKAQAAIVKFLRERVMGSDDPRQNGKALKGDLGGLWRYRVGDCRIICDIQDNIITVLVLRIRDRKEVYRR